MTTQQLELGLRLYWLPNACIESLPFVVAKCEPIPMTFMAGLLAGSRSTHESLIFTMLNTRLPEELM